MSSWEKTSNNPEHHGVPDWGVVNIKGKIYVTRAGLDFKLKQLCEQKGLTILSFEDAVMQHPTQENGLCAEVKSTLKLFDRAAFKESVSSASAARALPSDSMAKIAEVLTSTYVGTGAATAGTSQVSRGHDTKGPLVDNLVMHAATRAQNRAIRLATGTGLTSVDELGEERVSKRPVAGPTTKRQPPPEPVEEEAPFDEPPIEEPPPPQHRDLPLMASAAQIRMVQAMCRKLVIGDEKLHKAIRAKWNLEHRGELSVTQASALIDALKRLEQDPARDLMVELGTGDKLPF